MSDYNGGSPTGKKLKQFMKYSKNAKDRVAKKMGESLPHKFSKNATSKDALKKAEKGEKQHTGKVQSKQIWNPIESPEQHLKRIRDEY